MTDSQEKLAIIIIGCTGDMALNKVYPALFRLAMAQFLDLNNTQVVGVARGKTEEIHDNNSFQKRLEPYLGPGNRTEFLERCIFVQGDCAEKQFQEETLHRAITKSFDGNDKYNRLLYFSMPWQVFERTIEAIPTSIALAGNEAGLTTKIVLEKPIGNDLSSCKRLVDSLYEKFGQESIYFLDHFMGKEMVQNIQVLRYMNAIMDPLWNKENVTAIRISCRESTLPTGSIYSYFEEHGIIRDIIIDHLMNIMALITMEPPNSFTREEFNKKKLELLQKVRPVRKEDVVLGRCKDYQGKQITFSTCILYIDTPRWKGIPIIMKAGKGLYEKRTDIRLQLKAPLYQTENTRNNEIVIRVNPSEDVYMKVMRKIPGPGLNLRETKMDFLKSHALPSNSYSLGSYERLILDVFNNDHTYFVEEEQLIERWRIFEPILEEIDLSSEEIISYDRHTRGPKESDELACRVGFVEQAKLPSELISVQPESTMNNLLKEFSVAIDRMKDVVLRFCKEMRTGLEGKPSSLKMLPSYVTTLPQGNETGIYYALDIGGTNFRVTRFSLDGKGNVHLTDERKFTIPDEVMVADDASVLHKFMADCIVNVGADKKENRKYGYTFSFPVEQKAIDSGILLNWTKGFKTKGVEGKDVVKPLREELKRRNFDAEISALVNDTVGTLASGAFKDPNCVIGVILGTGTNAAYVEKVKNIKKLPADIRSQGGEMVINIEWGAFGDLMKTLPTCRIDERLDANSRNPGRQSFEKMISGFYLGEIARLCLKELVEAKEIYNKAQIPDKLLNQPYSFESRYLSDVEYDLSNDLHVIKRVEAQYGIWNSSLEDRRILKEVCGMVVERAARLTAIAIAATVIQTSRRASDTTVGVDGSVYEHHPSFRRRLQQALSELGCDCSVILSKDGSGRGAALIACGVAKQKQTAAL